MDAMATRNKSKILLVVSFTYPYHAGGGLSALNFAEYLNQNGYPTKILTFNRNISLPSKSFIKNTWIYRIPYINKNIFFKILSVLFILPSYIVEILRSKTILIYGGYIIGWEIMVFLGRIFKKRVIFRSTMFSEDDAGRLLENKWPVKTIRNWALHNIDNYLSLTPLFSEAFSYYIGLPEKIINSPQGVNTNRFAPADKVLKKQLKEKLNVPDDIFIIISIGILIRRKGYLEIFDFLSQLEKPFIYLILGDFHMDKTHHIPSSDREALELYNYGKSLLNKKIRFEGFVDNVEEYLKVSDLFIIGSHKEGLPNALLEAMACGLPIIARNSNYLINSLLVNKKNSLLYSEPEEFSRALNRLYSDQQLRKKLGEKARKDIMKFYTYAHTIQKLKL